MKKALFLFHRDLRLEDNTGLNQALGRSEKVIPAFILDPAQIERNPYRGDHALQFMFQSLADLDEQLGRKGSQLYLFYGKTAEIIRQMLAGGIDAVFSNRDYTPFARKRDEEIRKLCEQGNIPFFSFADALLHEPGDILKQNGKPYTIFTPYFRVASQVPVASVQANERSNYFSGNLPESKPLSLLDQILPQANPSLAIRGGRAQGLKLLANIVHQKNYDQQRDIPSLDGTTHLSAHHKFGTISARETYYAIQKAFGSTHPLIRELFWRDFFTQIAFYFPHVFGHAFHQKYDLIPWRNGKDLFNAWKQGKTGFPIVDAGMRQLNETGFMHNRVRMIAASFLVKDLHIDWRWGERYFARKLVDYDPAVNNGNWQWAASTGCDAQPYFRIFNPWLQQKKFDPDCLYIRRWIPELEKFTPKEIHGWQGSLLVDYPAPVVDHAKQAGLAKQLFGDR